MCANSKLCFKWMNRCHVVLSCIRYYQKLSLCISRICLWAKDCSVVTDCRFPGYDSRLVKFVTANILYTPRWWLMSDVYAAGRT